MPALVQHALEEFAAGNLVEGLEILLGAVFDLASFTTDTLLPPIQNAIVGPLDNLANVVFVLTDPANIFNGGFALVGPVLATALASAQAVEDVIAGDPDALTALINAPATIADGLLNGFDFPGLLSPPDDVFLAGPIGFALELRQQIAVAIGAPEPPLASEAAVNELPADAKLVPLDVNPGPAPAVEESDADTTNGNGTVLKQPDNSPLLQDKERRGPRGRSATHSRPRPASRAIQRTRAPRGPDRSRAQSRASRARSSRWVTGSGILWAFLQGEDRSRRRQDRSRRQH